MIPYHGRAVELETHHHRRRVDAHALGAGVGGGTDVQGCGVSDQRVVRAVDADEGEAFDAEDGEHFGGSPCGVCGWL